MRRVVLAIVGTVAGLVVLLTFKSHTGTPAVSAAAPAGAAGPGGTAGASSGAGTANGAGGATPSGAARGTSGGGSAPSGSSAPPGTAPGQGDATDTRIITGNVANTIYGPVQIQAAVKAGKIIKVTILQQPSTTAHDLQIGAFAFPQLEAETLSAQSAKIDMVSGATYTSGGYIQSLQSAIDRGA
ncbi:MAG: FMN-binding protein [Streptosporangiaceae bacterium]